MASKFKWRLETMDHKNPEFQRYLTAHSIECLETGFVHGQPGGGVDIVYTADTRQQLVGMYLYWWYDYPDPMEPSPFDAIEEVPEGWDDLPLDLFLIKHGNADSGFASEYAVLCAADGFDPRTEYKTGEDVVDCYQEWLRLKQEQED